MTASFRSTPTILLLFVLVVLLMGFMLYRWRSSTQLAPVEPHAREVIEKAKQR